MQLRPSKPPTGRCGTFLHGIDNTGLVAAGQNEGSLGFLWSKSSLEQWQPSQVQL